MNVNRLYATSRRSPSGETIHGSNNAPDLTHFASRECFAGCMFENNDESLRRWLDDPPAMKPGSLMPDYELTPEQAFGRLVGFLARRGYAPSTARHAATSFPPRAWMQP